MVIYVNPYATTIDKVKQDMLSAGCVDAINLDGGGSTQISTKKYGSVYSPEGRKVHNYICIWEDSSSTTNPTTSTPTTSTPKQLTKSSDLWAEFPTDVSKFPKSAKMVISTDVRAAALSGAKSVATMNKGAIVQVSGYAGIFNKSWVKVGSGYLPRTSIVSNNPYTKPTSMLRKGSRGEGVKWLQWLLCQRGYKGADGKPIAADGSFGANTDYAVRTFQREQNLEIDGVCGPATIARIG